MLGREAAGAIRQPRGEEMIPPVSRGR
jgi:hypothetical protein